MADQNGLQLLPETRRKIEVKVPGENRLIYLGTAILILMFVLTGGLYFYKNTQEATKDDLDSQIIKLEKDRDKKVESNLLTLSKQLSLISTLLDSHVAWSKALGKVESLLQPQVQFETFSAAVSDNRFEFKALATNYTVVARQIAAFVSDDSIKDIALNNVHVLTSGKLEFSVKLQFDKTKFIKE
jgi:Tfp pilus assembly protein PilN